MKVLIPSVATRKNFSETQDFLSKYNAVHLDYRFQKIAKELKLIVYQPVTVPTAELSYNLRRFL